MSAGAAAPTDSEQRRLGTPPTRRRPSTSSPASPSAEQAGDARRGPAVTARCPTLHRRRWVPRTPARRRTPPPSPARRRHPSPSLHRLRSRHRSPDHPRRRPRRPRAIRPAVPAAVTTVPPAAAGSPGRRSRRGVSAAADGARAPHRPQGRPPPVHHRAGPDASERQRAGHGHGLRPARHGGLAVLRRCERQLRERATVMGCDSADDAAAVVAGAVEAQPAPAQERGQRKQRGEPAPPRPRTRTAGPGRPSAPAGGTARSGPRGEPTRRWSPRSQARRARGRGGATDDPLDPQAALAGGSSSYSSISRRRARKSVDSTDARLMPSRSPISR